MQEVWNGAFHCLSFNFKIRTYVYVCEREMSEVSIRSTGTRVTGLVEVLGIELGSYTGAVSVCLANLPAV